MDLTIIKFSKNSIFVLILIMLLDDPSSLLYCSILCFLKKLHSHIPIFKMISTSQNDMLWNRHTTAKSKTEANIKKKISMPYVLTALNLLLSVLNVTICMRTIHINRILDSKPWCDLLAHPSFLINYIQIVDTFYLTVMNSES